MSRAERRKRHESHAHSLSLQDLFGIAQEAERTFRGRPGALEPRTTSTYRGRANEHEGVTTDEKTSHDQGRLRLQRPTFRGSSVGWGIAAVLWLSCAVPALIRVVHFGGPSAGGFVLLAALVVASAVCVIGTVATIRHPRPAPPAVDS
ncbi:hypothetical protein ASG05_01905 [Frigoribacterium sp. Leaf186]|nr:hypothetical protein ASG05_01905 [Frigoribacterium sp. Leaf186]